jgi:hypothetical protein
MKESDTFVTTFSFYGAGKFGLLLMIPKFLCLFEQTFPAR